MSLAKPFWVLFIMTWIGPLSCSTRAEYSPEVAKRAIEKAEGYLQKQETLKPDEMAILLYLDRKFGLSWVSDRITQEKVDRLASGPWFAFLRLMKPGFLPPREAISQKPSSIDRMTLSALYCDVYGLPPRFEDLLISALSAEHYWPTHAVLAAIWAHENGCLDHETLAELQPLMREALLRTIYLHTAVDDFFAEAIALAFYAGFGADIETAWLAELAKAQSFTGGWRATPRTPWTSPHTTVLALWALLEATQGSGNHTPWIR